ncbi:MAG: DUF433 domain-containing protein [Planctomycetes bacterium]|nr:DUF433 domain-containing protein [Planctomycetota bacterium]
MTLPDFLTQDEFGAIRISGGRIGLEHVLHFYKEGYSPEMLWSEYPTLPLALIHKVIVFYLENQVEVDAYLASFEREMEEARSRPRVGPDVEELRRRLASFSKAQGA